MTRLLHWLAKAVGRMSNAKKGPNVMCTSVWAPCYVTDSIVTTCDDCRMPVRVSASLLESVPKDARMMCPVCARKKAQSDTVLTIEIPDSQLEIVRKLFGPHITREHLAKLARDFLLPGMKGTRGKD